MALTCAHCGSSDTSAMTSTVCCLNCGQLTDYNGEAATAGPDASTRAALQAALDAPTAPQVSGNLADLNRIGAEVLSSGETNLDNAVAAPPGLSAEAATAGADATKADIAAAAETAVSTGTGTGTNEGQAPLNSPDPTAIQEENAQTQPVFADEGQPA